MMARAWTSFSLSTHFENSWVSAISFIPTSVSHGLHVSRGLLRSLNESKLLKPIGGGRNLAPFPFRRPKPGACHPAKQEGEGTEVCRSPSPPVLGSVHLRGRVFAVGHFQERD